MNGPPRGEQRPARLAICDYGMGNLRSVSRAAEKAGAVTALVSHGDGFDPQAFDGLVLPGQGHFDRCVENLREAELDHVVMEWCQRDRPFLGICVGMQILAESSDEGGAIGLGIVAGNCVKVGGGGLSVPHMGWDQLTWKTGGRLFAGVHPSTRFYFCHSYGVVPGTGAEEALAEYGPVFVGALEQGRTWAVQFHPEKSSGDGLRIWENFLGLCLGARAEREAGEA